MSYGLDANFSLVQSQKQTLICWHGSERQNEFLRLNYADTG